MRPMDYDVSIDRPADEVWAHLREPALIRRWFGWDYDGLEREIEIIFSEEAAVDDAARTLTWETGDRFALDGSTLRIHHEPPAEGYDDIGEGWITFAEQLPF